MVSRGLGIIKGGLAKKGNLPNNPRSVPYPTTFVDSANGITKIRPHRSSARDLAPLSKLSGLDQALKFLRPRTTKSSEAKLKIAPSGVIVFTPVLSQESLVSSVLPGKALFLPTYKIADERAQPRLRLYNLQTRVPQGLGQRLSKTR